MRTYFRKFNEDGTNEWLVISTAANGDDSMVYLVTLIQCILLNLNESPFFANYGIPAQQSVLTQVLPDFYMLQLQTLFAPYFASIIVSRLPGPIPTYNVAVTTFQGAQLTAQIVT